MGDQDLRPAEELLRCPCKGKTPVMGDQDLHTERPVAVPPAHTQGSKVHTGGPDTEAVGPRPPVDTRGWTNRSRASRRLYPVGPASLLREVDSSPPSSSRRGWG